MTLHDIQKSIEEYLLAPDAFDMDLRVSVIMAEIKQWALEVVGEDYPAHEDSLDYNEVFYGNIEKKKIRERINKGTFYESQI